MKLAELHAIYFILLFQIETIIHVLDERIKSYNLQTRFPTYKIAQRREHLKIDRVSIIQYNGDWRTYRSVEVVLIPNKGVEALLGRVRPVAGRAAQRRGSDTHQFTLERLRGETDEDESRLNMESISLELVRIF